MAEHTITIQNFQFNPPNGEPVVITVGDSVKWVNRDSARHNAVREEVPTFATRLLGRDETSDPIVFDQATGASGIEYKCGPHPAMRGRIIVSLAGTDMSFYAIQESTKAHDAHGDQASKKS